MASGIISATNNSDALQMRIVWSSTSNGTEANSSTVTAQLQLRKNRTIPTWGTWTVESKYFGWSGSYGKDLTQYESVGNEWVTFRSGTGTVKHNADGTKTINMYATVRGPDGTTLEGVTRRASATVTLDKIPQHGYITGISEGEFNSIDTAPTITYTNPAGEDITALDVCISLDKVEDNIAYRAVSKTGTSHKLVLTQSDLNTLYNAMPEANSLLTYVYMRSKIGDLTSYSSREKTFYIKDKTINHTATITDTNLETVALTGNNQKFIKGYSNAQVTLTSTPATIGSTLTAQTIKNGGNTIKGNSTTFYSIDDASFTFSATDTRGNSTTQTVTRDIVNYLPLTCELSVDMPDIQGNASFTISGNYWVGNFGAVDNELIVLVRQIIDGVEGEWQTVTYTVSGNTFTADGALGGFSQDKTCIVEARVADKLLTKETTQDVLIIPVFDWSHDDFNFNVPVTIQGDLTVTGAISIDKGQELLWSGEYYMIASQTAELSKPITEQANGIVLVFSRYSNSTAQDYGWNCFFVPKSFMNYNNSGGISFIMATSGFTTIATKYVYITDNAVKGNVDNDLEGTNNGITFNNKDYVLRYIIGV